MASKMRKLILSNEAHSRLAMKHLNDKSVTGTTKYHYHSIVKDNQLQRGYILSRRERNFIFNKIFAGTKRGEFK